MKVCFTINCMRTSDDFIGYDKLIKENKFQAIEIFYPYNVSLEQRKLYEDNLTKLLSDNKLEVVLHLPHGGKNNFINPDLTPNDEVVNLMLDAIMFGVKYNAHKFTLHLGSSYTGLFDRNIVIDKVLTQVKKLLDLAKKYNAYIMIENMPGFNELAYGIKETKEILNKLAKSYDNIKFIMDTGHAHCSDDEVWDYVYELKDYLYHIHFSDNDRSCDQHKRIHLGTIDFDKVFKALNEVHYKELHCLEIIFKTYLDLDLYESDIREYEKYYNY